MYLWSKAVLFLLFSGVMVVSDKCKEGSTCLYQKFNLFLDLTGVLLNKSGIGGGFPMNISFPGIGNRNAIADGVKACCFAIYSGCFQFSDEMSGCPKNVSSGKEAYDSGLKLCSQLKTSATKDNCVKYHQKVGDNCKKYEVSVCENYTWNSFPRISSNVFILSVLVFISIIIIF